MSLNLASQPFVNSRPVRRLVFVLWCLGALLVAANVFFYASYFSGQSERRDRLAELTERDAAERQRLEELEQRLAGFDLDWQNRQVGFLNLRIAERVFPWSRLFDRVSEALPADVRLIRLRPEVRGGSGAAGAPEETVQLEIRAEARTEEAMLDFIGRLFEHPAFRDPNLSSENRRGKANVTEFSLGVTYLPVRAASAATAPAPASEPPAGEVAGQGAPEEAEQ